MRDAPAAIVKIVRSQAQSMASLRILGRIIIPRPRHLRLERRAADHPCRMIDDAAMTRISGTVGHLHTFLLLQSPAAQQGTTWRWPEPPVLKTFGHFRL